MSASAAFSSLLGQLDTHLAAGHFDSREILVTSILANSWTIAWSVTLILVNWWLISFSNLRQTLISDKSYDKSYDSMLSVKTLQ